MEDQEPVIGRPALAEPDTSDLTAELAQRLKVTLAGTLPGLDPALIAGESAGEIEASFDALREAVSAAHPVVAVPAGAPGRVTLAPQTPFAKIRDGLSRL